MESSEQQHSDARLRLAREQAVLELAELRSMDADGLTAQMLVRKAILLQFEDATDGTPQEIEDALHAALDRDDKCIEAYIELGRYYYAVLDDSRKAKVAFLKGLDLLRGFNKEIVQGLLDCDEELHPDRNRCEIQTNYQAMLLGAGNIAVTAEEP